MKKWNAIQPSTVYAANRLRDGSLIPNYWPILPQDQSAIVDRVVKLLSSKVPAASMPTVLGMLNMGPSELERIKEMLQDPVFGPLFKTATQGGPEDNQE